MPDSNIINNSPSPAIDYTNIFQEISDKLYKDLDSGNISSSNEIKSKIGTKITGANKKFLGKYDLDRDGKITENDYKLYKDLAIGNIPSSNEIKSKIGTKITAANKKALGKYDLDGDGKITENDYNIAFENENPPSLISVLKQIRDILYINQFTNKDQYIKYVAAKIFSYSDFDRFDANNLLNRAIQNANLIADKFNW